MKHIKNYIKTLFISLALGACAIPAFAEPADASVQQSVAVSQPQVRVLNDRIEITVSGEEDCPVTIYALTGQVVKSFTAVQGVNSVELPKGYYIVKCDRYSCRVVVK